MMLKSVTAGKTRVLLAAALALMAQGAWSDESNDPRKPAGTPAAHATETSAKRPVEVDVRAYIEALNKRLADELAREIEALNAARIELVVSEVPTRG